MQKNFAIVSVFILSAVLQGWVMYCAGKDTLAIKILSLALMLVCLILLTIRYIRWQKNHHDPCYICSAAGHSYPLMK